MGRCPRVGAAVCAAVMVATGVVVSAPATHAGSNDTELVLAETTWPHDLRLTAVDIDRSTKETDVSIISNKEGTLSVQPHPSFSFGTVVMSVVHNFRPTARVTLSGEKYDLDGTAYSIDCSFTINDPVVGFMSIEDESGCAGSVAVDLSGGFGSYTATMTLVGEPRFRQTLTRAETLAGVGAAVRANEDCIRGTNGDDTIVGTPGDDCIIAGSGNDTIDGRGGNDTIFAGPGDDAVQGGDGNDTIFAGSGDDTVDGGSGEDFVHGATGNDTIVDDDDDADTVMDSQFGGDNA